ncbi:HSF-type DNA-binding [Seminavis robusta]|uniref:HSF-type DNA-binding n=1 Tax=Seminavis robusta TaxID=568900 RepID=A0A9N8DUK5_9STRA|nr:HSF-type DNA-binding [Seminavis robusta]|eukprot:Sro383_g131220.1 HSF-type DNA-binding (302) ;mRNA; r:10408-12017
MRASTKRSNPSKEDSSVSSSEEKTIPFLRRLTDMLLENEEFISFEPGCHIDKDGKRVLGKIVVHDRVKVESSILPRYFNHSSFASLRRQLNYFAFTRIGKGRQRGATYCNEGVVVLEDILSLKRRSVTNSSAATVAAANAVKKATAKEEAITASKAAKEDKPKNKPNKRMRLTPPASTTTNSKVTIGISDLGTTRNVTQQQTPTCSVVPALTPARVTPVGHLTNQQVPPKRISLDLTSSSTSALTPPQKSVPLLQSVIFNTTHHHNVMEPPKPTPTTVYGDDDILAGCKALLCFSRGIPSR